jgi:PAS domain S-box-containing protein
MENRHKNRTFITSIVSLVILSILLFAILSTYININIYTEHITNNIKKSNESYLIAQKEKANKQVHMVNDVVKLHQNNILTVLETRIKERLENVHRLSKIIYDQSSKKLSKEEIKTKIANQLSTIKHDHGEGYLYVYDNHEHKILTHPIPTFIGKDMRLFKDNHGLNILKNNETLFKTNKIAISTFYFNKPNDTKNEYKKLSGAIKFKPLDITIGTGIYLDAAIKKHQQYILTRFKDSTFTKNSYVFILDLHNIEGGKKFATMLLNSNRPDLVNKPIDDNFKGEKGKEFNKVYLKDLRLKGESYVDYWFKKVGQLKPVHKMSYFYHQKEWNWIIGSGFYFDDLEAQISQKEQERQSYIQNMIYTSIKWVLLLLLLILPITVLIAIKIDKTIQNNANSLLRQKNFISTLLNLLPIPIFSKDRNGNYLLVNKAFEELTGFTSQEVVNKSIFDIAPKEIANTYHVLDQKVFLLEDNPQIYESEVINRVTEKKFDVIFYKSAFFDDKNEVDGLVGAVINITDQKALSKQLQVVNASLQEKITIALEENTKQLQLLQQQSQLAAMGEMIGAIAHQWRQPLNILSINVQNLEDDFEEELIDQQFINNFVKNNHEIIDFMSNTIDDFKNFFRKDKVKSHFMAYPVIVEILRIFDAQLKEHTITVNIVGQDFQIYGYQNEFKQVLLNIINNAKDAILSHPNNKSTITIELKNNSITISDTGNGIQNDILYRIFDPYFSTKALDKGTGLGLYISKMIIEENFKGKLCVKNIEEGAQFTISF